TASTTHLNLGAVTTDAKVGTLTVGTTNFGSSSLNANSATVTFGAGTFDVNNVVMGFKAGAGVLNAATNVAINVTGGTFLVNNSFSMVNTNVTANMFSTVNVTGGTLSAMADITQTGALAAQTNINVN